MADQSPDEAIILPEDDMSLEDVASTDNSSEGLAAADIAPDATTLDRPDTIPIVESETAEEKEPIIELAPIPPADFDTTPRDDGFRMPAEYEPHARCWMLWPYRGDVWRENAYHAHRAFARVAQTIAKFEPVTVGCRADLIEEAQQILGPNISVVPVDYNDSWVRDNGPTFVTNDEGELRAVDWEFNAWGGLYEPFEHDRRTASQIAQVVNAKRYKANFVLEGGAIHTDGDGTLITTEECLLNPNRNPDLSKSEIEERLMTYLNIEKVIWLKRGVFLDETSGHVDNLVCFARPGEILLTWTDDPDDPQYDISHEAYEILSTTTDAQERSFKVHRLHQPTPMYYSEDESLGIEEVETSYERLEGQRMAASYANFYIANGGIIMPIFNDITYDTRAAETIQTAFPRHRVKAVYAREILLGGGNIHCITQQQPKVEKKK